MIKTINQAFRKLYRNKITTLINLAGLSTAMAAAFFLLVFAKHEGRYDTHNKNSEQIFRLIVDTDFNGSPVLAGRSSFGIGRILSEQIPEIESYLRLMPSDEQTVKFESELHNEKNICYSDQNLLKFFEFDLVAGSGLGMTEPNKVLIRKSVAEKFFGNPRESVGKILTIGQDLFEVVGVIDPPTTTQIPFDFFISVSSLPSSFEERAGRSFLWLNTYNYIFLRDGFDPGNFESKLADFYDQVLDPWTKQKNISGQIRYKLQELGEVHTDNTVEFNYAETIDQSQLNIMKYLGYLILFVASVNYMNLFTAQISKYSVDAGIRKVNGASPIQLMIRFFAEIFLVIVISLGTAILLMYLLFPVFISLTGLQFSFNEIVLSSISWIIPLVLLIGLVTGIYPALYISEISALEMLGKREKKSPGKRIFYPVFIRRFLVVFQMAVSGGLIIALIVISKQIEYLFDRNLGFDKEAVFVIDVPNDKSIHDRMPLFKSQLKEITGVVEVAGCSVLPGEISGQLTFNVDQQNTPEILGFNYAFVDSDFLDVMDIELVAGQNFRVGSKSDLESAFLVNETLVQEVSWDDPINKRLIRGKHVGSVKGVVRDFNHSSMYNPIEPLVLFFREKTKGFILVKLETTGIEQTLGLIKKSWQDFDQSNPFNGFFLNENFRATYDNELRIKSIVYYIGILALVITCLGLLGMIMFTLERRLKEISIRKTIGASVHDIVILLVKEYLILILISVLFSVPLTIHLLNRWLQSFAYQSSITSIPILISIVICTTMMLAIIVPLVVTVFRRNLVEVLRNG